jgi:hypothetical protein
MLGDSQNARPAVASAASRRPRGVRVRYVDNLTPEEMKRHYAAALDREPVPPDMIDDAQHLAKFGDDSLDFLIANHLLEHIEDPIDALRHFSAFYIPAEFCS